MAYCTATEVKVIVYTTMTDLEIDGLIEGVDELMDLQGVTGSVVILREISRFWSAYRVALRDPDSYRIGEVSKSRGDMLERMKAEYEGMIATASGGITFLIGKPDYE